MKKVYESWNRIPRIAPSCVHGIHDRYAALPVDLPRPYTVYGNGRSYGDVCLTDTGTLLHTRGLDRFIQFDATTGRLCCEAGVTLADILELSVPHGWFLPVTPGTQHVTVGGAVANDVHGKNHHVMGSFGNHVVELELTRSDGERIVCSPQINSAWFSSSIGGLGLTGLICRVEFQLMRVHNPFMWVASRRFRSLSEFWNLNAEAEQTWPYSVAWVDCTSSGDTLGRGILLTGRHAGLVSDGPRTPSKRRSIPFELPGSPLNRTTLRIFNALYYRQPTRPAGQLMHYMPYFYPLDAIGKWNRMYGKRGFYQYQCVVPPEAAPHATEALLTTVARRGQGSFLAVLKTFGPVQSMGMLSFPRPGLTLALDFPNRGNSTLALLAELDSIVKDAGGAIYPAKDARMPASVFKAGFPRWEEFSQFVDPGFSSSFWRRVSS